MPDSWVDLTLVQADMGKQSGKETVYLHSKLIIIFSSFLIGLGFFMYPQDHDTNLKWVAFIPPKNSWDKTCIFCSNDSGTPDY